MYWNISGSVSPCYAKGSRFSGQRGGNLMDFWLNVSQTVQPLMQVLNNNKLVRLRLYYHVLHGGLIGIIKTEYISCVVYVYDNLTFSVIRVFYNWGSLFRNIYLYSEETKAAQSAFSRLAGEKAVSAQWRSEWCNDCFDPPWKSPVRSQKESGEPTVISPEVREAVTVSSLNSPW